MCLNYRLGTHPAKNYFGAGSLLIFFNKGQFVNENQIGRDEQGDKEWVRV